MLVYNWPKGENEKPSEDKIETLDDLWELVNRKVETESDTDELLILEVSANTEPYGTKYLVLTWVDVMDVYDGR